VAFRFRLKLLRGTGVAEITLARSPGELGTVLGKAVGVFEGGRVACRSGVGGVCAGIIDLYIFLLLLAGNRPCFLYGIRLPVLHCYSEGGSALQARIEGANSSVWKRIVAERKESC